ncbi:MAG: DUF3298 domain-containing protein [Candidatus Staskawiczbacteria bacterium]
MKQKNILILVILVIIIIGSAVFLFFNKNIITTVLAPQSPDKATVLTIQDKKITDRTSPFVIDIIYPYISGFDDFNKKAEDIINKELENFKINSLENEIAVKETDPMNYAEHPREYVLNIGYNKGQIDIDNISIIFNIYSFQGGAHGASYFIPLNYNTKSKQEIKLADLFPNQPDYLQKISDYCVADLKKQLTKSLGNLDGTWIQDGAGPSENNYSTFLINKDNIIFYFPQYQVAFYAAGDFKVIYPR